MGTSGGVPVVIPPIPSMFQIAVPTLPLIAIGTYNTTVNWPAPFPGDPWAYCIDQRQLLGKAVAAVTNCTSASCTLTVTASLLLAAGAQVHILAWA